MDKVSPLSPRNEILQLIGVIVLSTQASERYLKLVLPFTDAEDPSLSAALARANKVQRTTFGNLSKGLVNAATWKSATFKSDLANLVKDRNRVVHHFGETFGKQLNAGDAVSVIDSLRIIRANARSFEQAMTQLALCVLEGLRDTTFSGTPEFHDLDAVCEELRRSLGDMDAACME